MKLCSKQKRVAVVGGGWYLKIHRDALALFHGWDTPYLVEVVAGSIGSKDRKARAEAMGLVGYDSPEAMAEAIQSGKLDVDYVLVCASDGAHEECSVPFLSRGIPVYIEKPLAHTLEAAKRIVRASREGNAALGVNFTYCYSLAASMARVVWMHALEWQPAQQFEATYFQGYERNCPPPGDPNEPAPLRWRRSEGNTNVKGDLFPHLLSTLNYVADIRATQVASSAGVILPGRTLDDNSTATLWAGNECWGRIAASQTMHGTGNPLHIRVDFEDAALEFSLGRNADTLLIHPKGGGTVALRFGQNLSNERWWSEGSADELSNAIGISTYPDEHHFGLCHWLAIGHFRFIRAIEQLDGGAFPKNMFFGGFSGTGNLGLHAQHVIEACVTSANNNCAVTPVAELD